MVTMQARTLRARFCCSVLPCTEGDMGVRPGSIFARCEVRKKKMFSLLNLTEKLISFFTVDFERAS
jgi:hypothetical protein